MGWQEDALEAIHDGLIKAFETVGSDVSEIENISRGFTLDDWRIYRIAQAASVALPALIPGASLLTIPAEMAVLFRFLHNSALGVGFIQRGTATPDDFKAIFMFSAEGAHADPHQVRQIAAKAQILAGNVAFATIGPQIGAKLIASAIVTQLGIVVGHALSPFAARKMAAWLARLLLPSFMARWVPLISVIVGGTMNGYITNKMIDSAIDYYRLVEKVRAELR